MNDNSLEWRLARLWKERIRGTTPKIEQDQKKARETDPLHLLLHILLEELIFFFLYPFRLVHGPGWPIIPCWPLTQTGISSESAASSNLTITPSSCGATYTVSQTVHKGPGICILAFSPPTFWFLCSWNSCTQIPKLLLHNVLLFFVQMSHLFNVAHNLRMLVQKERSLDILKVRETLNWDNGNEIWGGQEKQQY